ncbi:MAG TPA: formate dehydrogenase accessory protein FdhE [Candidatus Hypogeohydataceae bacterium YC38]|nr:formate dehydrogenase accessory protein FdhE [Candidatus Brocadiales bacterium]
MNLSWDKRISRAEELTQRYPFARELLGFYCRLTAYQKDLYGHLDLEDCSPTLKIARSGKGLRKELPLTHLLPLFPSLLSLVKEIGPPGLSQVAQEMESESEVNLTRLLEAYWNGRELVHPAEGADSRPLAFFARAFLQPLAQYLAEKLVVSGARLTERSEEGPESRPLCPFCGARPQVGYLHASAEGSKRSLVCSLCFTEWAYRRLSCPGCGEEAKEKLSYYTAQEFAYMRVDTCDSCGSYIKIVDMSKEPPAIPVVDELAAIPLDLWAQEQGYKKVESNVLGI